MSRTPYLMLDEIPPCLYLMGDEDCDVSLQCRETWNGGQPLAFYQSHQSGTDPYAGREPPVVHCATLAELMWAIAHHHHDPTQDKERT